MNDEKLKEIVASLIDKLIKEPDGYCTTTFRLLRDTGCDTDSLSSDDLMSIHFALFEEAGKEDLFLDMSEHLFKLEGLPYVLDFTVRKNWKRNEGLMVSIMTEPMRNPLQGICVRVYDREEENVEVCRDLISEDPDITFTMTGSVLDSIKDCMKEPSLRQQPEEGYEEDRCLMVEDGDLTDVYLFFAEEYNRFTYANIDCYKDCLEKYPQTGTVYKIMTAVMSEVGRELSKRDAEELEER